MTRISAHLAAIEAWLKLLPHDGALIVKDVKRQLDLVDAEDVERQSFASPAGFLVMPRFRLIARPDGGRDAEIWVVIAIAAKGSAAKPMDEDVIDRAITLAAALDDQDFGQVSCSPAADIEARPVLQASLETRGIAVAAVSFRQILFSVTVANQAVTGLAGAFGAGGPIENNPVEFTAPGGTGLTPEEQAIVQNWSGGSL